MKEIPALDDWISLTEAASIMGVTRQYVHKLTQQGGFQTLHKIPGARDVLVVERTEAQRLADVRAVLKEGSSRDAVQREWSGAEKTSTEAAFEASEEIIADVQRHLNQS